MSEVVHLRLEFADQGSAATGAVSLQNRLSALPEVGEAVAVVDDYLLDTEQVVVGVTAAIQLAQLAGDGASSVTSLLRNVRELARELRGLKGVSREVDGELRHLDDFPFDASDDEA